MNTEAPALGAPLERWFAQLDGQDFRVGVRERLLVQSLLAQLAASGELPGDLRATLALAAPLLCTTADQQRRYAGLLDRFIASGGGAPVEPITPRHPRGPAPRFGNALAAACWALALLLVWWAAVTRTPATSPEASAPVPALPTQPAQTTPPTPPLQGPVAASAPVPPVYVPPLSLPLQPDLPPAWSAPARVAALVLGAGALLVLLWSLRQRRRGQVALQSLRTDEDLVHHRLHEADPVDAAPHPVLARAVARVLRQRVAGDTRTLDTAATLRATVAAAGAYTPRWRELQRTPEYLVLLDTRHPADHYAAAARTLVDALARAGVALQVWAYDTTPAAGCWAVGAVGNDQALTRQRLPLATLAGRAAGARLLVFGATEALVDSASNGLPPWVAPLQTLGERAWFTPVPVRAWSAPEAAADSAGFLVLPLQQAALVTLAAWLSSGRLTLALDADTPASFPARLRGAALDWVTRADPPPPDVVTSLMHELRRMLGATRMQWLAACAIYPAVSPALTLALGRHLLDDPRALALGLASLSALPWFRYGRMPAWLRKELLAQLAPDLRKVLDERVQQRLVHALSDDDEAPLLADITTRKQRLWAALKRAQGPLQDVVLADFVRQGLPPQEEGLAHRLSPALRRRLFKGGDPAQGLRAGAMTVPAVALAMAVVAATPLWSLLAGTTAQPALLPQGGKAASSGAGPVQAMGGLYSFGESRVYYAYVASSGGGVAGSYDFLGSLGSGGASPSMETELATALSNGLHLDLDGVKGTLRVLDAQGRPVGAPLDTGGLRALRAGFTPSGSRVVALLEDGSLQSWGRPWPAFTVAFVGCRGEDAGSSEAGRLARRLVARGVQIPATVEAYNLEGWQARVGGQERPDPPPHGVLRVGGRPAELANGAQWAEGLAGTTLPSSVQLMSMDREGVEVGACSPTPAAAASASPTQNRLTASPGLSQAEVQALDRRVLGLFDTDATARSTATRSLLADRNALSDAVPLALAQAATARTALQAATPGLDAASARAGIANTLSLLLGAPPATLQRERAGVTALLQGLGKDAADLTTQTAAVERRLRETFALRPQISIQIADERQRPLASLLTRRLQAEGHAVAGTEAIGDRAPADLPQVRVQGYSDRRIARELRATTASTVGGSAFIVGLPAATPATDTYEIWFDRDVCVTRRVAGCDGVAGPAVQAQQARQAQQATQVQPAPMLQQAPPAQAAPTASAAALPPAAFSTATLDLVATFEGLQQRPYKAPDGRLMIGYGHALTPEEQKLQRVRIGDTSVGFGGPGGISVEDARRLLEADLVPWARQVGALVQVPLGPNEFGALVSYAYNQGMGTLRNSRILALVNAGDLQAVPGELRGGSTAASALYPGVQRRRQAEAELWSRDLPSAALPGKTTQPSELKSPYGRAVTEQRPLIVRSTAKK